MIHLAERTHGVILPPGEMPALMCGAEPSGDGVQWVTGPLERVTCQQCRTAHRLEPDPENSIRGAEPLTRPHR